MQDCEYRVKLETLGYSFCQHTQVHSKGGVVSDKICAGCTMAKVHCPEPRPVPSELPIVTPPLPPLYKRLANFSVAAISHVLAGMPTCTQEQIDVRLGACQACPLFKPSKSDPDKGVCTHSSCGCTAGREAKFLNKLAWSDQQCPLGKWPAIS